MCAVSIVPQCAVPVFQTTINYPAWVRWRTCSCFAKKRGRTANTGSAVRPGCAVSALLVSHVACLLLTWRDWVSRRVLSPDGAAMGAGSRQRKRHRRHGRWCEPTPLDCVSPPGADHAVCDICHGLCAAKTTMSGRQSLWCVHAGCGLHCFAAQSDYLPYFIP